MNHKLDIIDMLDSEVGYVQLNLKAGGIEFGMPLCIVYNEDENGVDTKKRILFKPYFGLHSKDYGLDDIESYEPIEEDDIPPHE